jgi:hypothetical protein
MILKKGSKRGQKIAVFKKLLMSLIFLETETR